MAKKLIHQKILLIIGGQLVTSNTLEVNRMTILGFILIGFWLFTSESLAQARKPMTISELVTHNGKDREQILYAGAKNEGKVTWYTSLAGDS